MKNFIVFNCLLICTSLFVQAQEEETDLKKFEFGFGMLVNLESVDKIVAEEVGVGATGLTLIDFRGRLSIFKYGLIDIGWGVSQFKDKLPFTEAVVFTSGQLSGLPSTATSEIVSGGWHYAIGGRAPLTKQVYLNAHIGKRRFSASRTIPECTNCQKTEIDLEAGTFVRGGLSMMSFKGKTLGEWDLLYTHYLNGDFKNTITLGFFVYL